MNEIIIGAIVSLILFTALIISLVVKIKAKNANEYHKPMLYFTIFLYMITFVMCMINYYEINKYLTKIP